MGTTRARAWAALLAVMVVGGIVVGIDAGQAGASPGPNQCDAEGTLEYQTLPYPTTPTLHRWHIAASGSCIDAAGAITTVSITDAPSDPFFSGSTQAPTCLDATGRGGSLQPRLLVTVRRTDQASGMTASTYQYWTPATDDVPADTSAVPGNATAFTIEAITYYGPHPHSQGVIGSGALFTKIFFACPGGDPHVRLSFAFTE